jgi:hypothetical protein
MFRDGYGRSSWQSVSAAPGTVYVMIYHYKFNYNQISAQYNTSIILKGLSHETFDPRFFHWKLAIFIIEYLREYESIFETALVYESVDPRALFGEKIGGRKSR